MASHVTIILPWPYPLSSNNNYMYSYKNGLVIYEVSACPFTEHRVLFFMKEILTWLFGLAVNSIVTAVYIISGFATFTINMY